MSGLGGVGAGGNQVFQNKVIADANKAGRTAAMSNTGVASENKKANDTPTTKGDGLDIKAFVNEGIEQAKESSEKSKEIFADTQNVELDEQLAVQGKAKEASGKKDEKEIQAEENAVHGAPGHAVVEESEVEYQIPDEDSLRLEALEDSAVSLDGKGLNDDLKAKNPGGLKMAEVKAAEHLDEVEANPDKVQLHDLPGAEAEKVVSIVTDPAEVNLESAQEFTATNLPDNAGAPMPGGFSEEDEQQLMKVAGEALEKMGQEQKEEAQIAS